MRQTTFDATEEGRPLRPVFVWNCSLVEFEATAVISAWAEEGQKS
jgi:hypothetical protein